MQLVIEKDLIKIYSNYDQNYIYYKCAYMSKDEYNSINSAINAIDN